MDADFFISFVPDDRAWAEWMAWELEDAGNVVVLQGWAFRPGANFALELRRAQPAQTTIVLLSPTYLAALRTQSEWQAEFGPDSGVVAVRVREFEPDGPPVLAQFIDLVGLDEAEARAHLLAGVHRAAPQYRRPATEVLPAPPLPTRRPSVPARGQPGARGASGSSSRSTSARPTLRSGLRSLGARALARAGAIGRLEHVLRAIRSSARPWSN